MPTSSKRRLVLQNSRFDVYFDEVGFDGDRVVSDYLVVAPKQVGHNLVTGVAVLPLVDGQIGLLEIFRHAVGESSWEIPRGFSEEGESAKGSAIRELSEETGLTCADEDVSFVGYITPDAGILAARIQLFIADSCEPAGEFSPVELGHRQFRLFPISQVYSMIKSGEIQDPSTLATLLHLKTRADGI